MMSMVLETGKLYHTELMIFAKFLHFNFPSCQVKLTRPNVGQSVHRCHLVCQSNTELKRTLSVSLGPVGKMRDTCQGHRGGEC